MTLASEVFRSSVVVILTFEIILNLINEENKGNSTYLNFVFNFIFLFALFIRFVLITKKNLDKV